MNPDRARILWGERNKGMCRSRKFGGMIHAGYPTKTPKCGVFSWRFLRSI